MRNVKTKRSDIDIDREAQKEIALKSKPKSVLEAFEYIVELAENSNLDDDFFDKINQQVRYAAQKLKLTTSQTVMLALFVDKSDNRTITLSDIAEYVGCRTTRFLRLSKDIDMLEEKRYIVASRSRRQLSYRVPSEVLNAIKNDSPYIYEPTPICDLQGFFDYFGELMEQKEEDELTHDRLLNLTMEGLYEVQETVYVKTLRRYKIDIDDTLIFTYMAHLYIENDDDLIGFQDLGNLFDNNKLPTSYKYILRPDSSWLIRSGLIENTNNDGMADASTFKLTDFAKKEMLGELGLTNKGYSGSDLQRHDSFPKKKLIYNAIEGEQIKELSSILSAKRFKGVQKRLENAGMRKGFCCIFYGAPGTGKTETVYQLARQTGRDIMRVDVDKIKSCWVGESEKNIKSLFERYRNICQNSELAPILLFNEADAVLGTRMEGASRAVDKMENSLQNIILQEMESIEGIMIATTNLTSNLDKAFERRFLYKVRFERPTEEARAQIWRALLPDLNRNQAAKLAAECDLTGGEIENIVRKHTVATILSGKETADLTALRKLCKTERISSSIPRIGF